MNAPLLPAAGFRGKRPGDKVRFLIPAGLGRHGIEWKPKTGKVAMKFPSHLVINGGGRHGTPFTVDDSNFLN